MTYSISRAEQELQAKHEQLNLRWYPRYHLAARAGWINDPNGLVWFDGWYHAFYQHHPYSTKWGPMHWGHARSKDLVHWEHLPVALAPEGPEDKDGCFSGSAVVDGDTLALIYTGHKFHGDPSDEANLYQVQCLATSRDGIHFERQGIVVDTPPGMHHFRDPKVWREEDSWYMIVGARDGDTGQVRLYRSADLRQWQDAGVLDEAEKEMGYMWECPDFFALNGKHILMFSPQGLAAKGYQNRNLFQSGYLLGEWRPGQAFVREGEFVEMDHGHDFYAPQSFLTPDGERGREHARRQLPVAGDDPEKPADHDGGELRSDGGDPALGWPEQQRRAVWPELRRRSARLRGCADAAPGARAALSAVWPVRHPQRPVERRRRSEAKDILR